MIRGERLEVRWLGEAGGRQLARLVPVEVAPHETDMRRPQQRQQHDNTSE